MSQNDTLIGSLDFFNLNNYPKNRYFFKLNYLPLSNSISIKFDEELNLTNIDYQLYYLVDEPEDYDFLCSEENKENSISVQDKLYDISFENENENKNTKDDIIITDYRSPKGMEFSKLLINTTIVINKKRISITKNNYLDYSYLLVGSTFIDFSVSEKIKYILDKVDQYEKRICDNFTVSYFYSL